MTPGYWRNEEATREAFSTAGCAPGTSACWTSRAVLTDVEPPQGHDHSGGLNISPLEDRTRGHQNESGVKEVAVISVPDAKFGEKRPRPWSALERLIEAAEVVERRNRAARGRQGSLLRRLRRRGHAEDGQRQDRRARPDPAVRLLLPEERPSKVRVSMPPAGVALVHGGGRGIGARISRRLAQDGSAVAVTYSRPAPTARRPWSRRSRPRGRAAAVGATAASPRRRWTWSPPRPSCWASRPRWSRTPATPRIASARSLGPERGTACRRGCTRVYCTHAASSGHVRRRWGRVIFLGSPAAAASVTRPWRRTPRPRPGSRRSTKVPAKEVARRGIEANVVVPVLRRHRHDPGRGDDTAPRLRRPGRRSADAVAERRPSLAEPIRPPDVSGEELGARARLGPVH